MLDGEMQSAHHVAHTTLNVAENYPSTHLHRFTYLYTYTYLCIDRYIYLDNTLVPPGFAVLVRCRSH
jgi:hypothetical protein